MLPLSTRLLLATAALFSAVPLSAQDTRRLTTGWQLAPETTAGERPTSGWHEVTVPSTFEDYLGTDFDGVCWYRLPLDVPFTGTHHATVRLLFHGAATQATVFLNGAEIGSHLGQWTPWRVELNDHLAADGQNLLEVRIDEKVGHNTQGFLPVIQPHFGGLWRSVELEIDTAPQFDRQALFSFGHWNGGAPTLDLRLPLRHLRAERGAHATVELLDGERPVARLAHQVAVDDERPLVLDGLALPAGLQPWSPDRPRLYTLRATLGDPHRDVVYDVLEHRVGFRDLAADGTTVLWNGRPLQVRGMLHWGYSPPHMAPPEDPAFWRPQLERIKALGCNLLKCCLWMPPRCVYEIADEIGLVVWQEYPTWHPTLTEEYLPELRQEYEEFHRYDRSHPSVAFRSLTCETGHSAELEVIRALYDRCKEPVPDTLVVDDSAWISWHRVHDFYDDHPYGNNSWWPGKIRSMKEYIAEREAKPLLLGECITSDTWVDFAKWDATGWSDDVWWAPWGIDEQREFMDWIAREFGPEHREALVPESERYALRNRKYQIERIRQSFPEAGYVLSVVRDITKCRMGFFDDFGDLKWPQEAWAWHGATMLCLDSEDDRRAFVASQAGGTELPVRIAHYGRGRLEGTLALRVPELGIEVVHDGLALDEGSVSAQLTLTIPPQDVETPRRLRVEGELAGSHPAQSHWDVWLIPAPSGTLDPRVRIVEALDAETIDWIRGGGRALLLAGDRENSLKTRGLWFLRGAPWAPEHAASAACPEEFLEHLQAFDLEDGRVLHWDSFMDQVDPLLAFWDTHDLDHVDRYLLAFTAGFGDGRLGATVLNHDTPAGRYVLEQLVGALADGPAPQRSWKPETIDTLRGVVTGQTLDLVDWQIALDADDVGLDAGWQDGGEHEGADWKPIRAGAHWEAQGFEQYTGVAWYRRDLAVPADWTDRPVNLVFESVDDSYHLFVDGELVERFGDASTGESVFLQRTYVDIAPHVTPGETARIVLRVVDHVGAGGVDGRAFVTTGPVAETADFVH